MPSVRIFRWFAVGMMVWVAMGTAQADEAPASGVAALVERPDTPVSKSDVALNPAHPERYVVVKGDTLWDISARFLRDPWLWPEVWYANPEIANPHLIYPGDVISLVYIDGKPRLLLERGAGKKDKLSPRVRAVPLDQAIPTIPTEAIRQFLSRTRVLSAEEIANAAYILRSPNGHILSGAGDRIYARRVPNDASQFSVFHPSIEYRDPETQESLGYEALFVADATLERSGNPATLTLLRSDREALVGDRLFPQTEVELDPFFQPRAPDRAIEGRILSVLDGVSQIGQYQVVALNRGTREGLAPGHVLAVYQVGGTILDPVTPEPDDSVALPDEQAGLVMVFRSFERVSFALVMRATQAIHVLDKVRNP